MTTVCEFATVTSDGELELHLQNLAGFHDEKIDLYWLHDRTAVPMTQLEEALALPANEGFAGTLYELRYIELGGKIVNRDDLIINAFQTPKTETITLKRREQLLSHDALLDEIAFVADAGGSVWSWPLPRKTLIVPNAVMFLHGLVTQGPSRRRCVDVEQFELPKSDIEELDRKARELQKLVVEREKRTGEELSRIAALQMADDVLRLQARHWSRHPQFGLDKDVTRREAAITDLRKTLDPIITTARTHMSRSSEEERVAEELMAFLDADAGKPGFREMMERIAVQPNVVGGFKKGVLEDALRLAFSALGRSVLAERFLRDHVFELMREVLEHMPKGFASTVARVADEEARELVTTRWREAMDIVEKGLGPPKSRSVLAGLRNSGRWYKTLTSLIAACLHEKLVLGFINAIDRVQTAERVPRTLQALAGVFLRFIATGGRLIGKGPKILTLGNRTRYDVVLSALSSLKSLRDGGATRSTVWASAGEQIRAAELDKAFLRSPSGVALLALANTAYLLYAIRTKPTDSVPQMLYIGIGMVGLGQAAAKGWEVAAERWATLSVDSARSSTRVLGRSAAILGLVVASVRLGHHMKTGQYKRAIVDATWMASSLATVASIGLGFTQYTLAAAWFGVAGVVIALGALTLEIVLAEDEGTLAVFKAYLGYGVSGEITSSASQEIETITATLLPAAESAAAFVLLPDSPGTRGRWEIGDPPTWFGAESLGFPRRDVAEMFVADEDQLEGVGLFESPAPAIG